MIIIIDIFFLPIYTGTKYKIPIHIPFKIAKINTNKPKSTIYEEINVKVAINKLEIKQINLGLYIFLRIITPM